MNDIIPNFIAKRSVVYEENKWMQVSYNTFTLSPLPKNFIQWHIIPETLMPIKTDTAFLVDAFSSGSR